MVTYGDSSSTVAPAWRASTRLTSVTPPWNRSTSAKTSTRLQVASTMASLTWSVPTSSCRALTVSSAPIANCSSSATGAVWWLTPTASRLTSPPRRRSSDAFAGLLCPWVSSRARSRGHLHRRRGRAALLAEEREDLQLDGEVDLADVDPRGRGQRHRREVQDAPHPGRGQPVADRLGDVGRTREHAQVHGQPGDGGLRDPGPGWGHGPLLAGARRPRALRSCAVARPRRLGHVALHKRSRSEVRRVPDAVERHRGPRRSAAPRTPREPLVNAGTKSLGGHQAAPQRRHAL